VAFGDELSDNGNGSYAHGITGNPANVYGSGTWTDGPVAVTYLAEMLGVPLVDYAFGGCCGGSAFGATIDNAYTSSPAQWAGAPVPSVHQQIRSNFTAASVSASANTLAFIWTGQNDVSLHTDAFWMQDPKNTAFAQDISSKILAEAEYLAALSPTMYVMVANIYPKHLAPVTKAYLCQDGGCVDTWGEIIAAANTAIRNALAGSKYSKQFIYHDVFGFMVNLMQNKDTAGLTAPLTSFCDGNGDASWNACAAGATVWDGAKKFYWMTFIQPTTTVHQLIAQDMKTTVDKFFSSA
jgi:phospholipase/lecithinase/hemolysin